MNIEIKIRGSPRFIQQGPIKKGNEHSSIVEKITRDKTHCKIILFIILKNTQNFPVINFSETEMPT